MKSFSQLTKEELFKQENQHRCCDRAELAGMLLFGAALSERAVRFVTENQDVLGSFANLCRTMGMEAKAAQSSENSARYVAEISDATAILQLLYDLHLTDPSSGMIRYRIAKELTENDCCRRAFCKGAFLSGGTVIDPKKNYNMEFVTPYLGLGRDMQQLLYDIGFSFKMAGRQSKYVLYLKNSESISDFLSYIGAFKAQMELLNIKIEKEIRNDFNRTANSETANLEKTINASVRQVRAIEEIQKTIGLDQLPEDLREIARLRLAHKEMSLSELGALMNPPLTKSGVNHRLKKLMQL